MGGRERKVGFLQIYSARWLLKAAGTCENQHKMKWPWHRGQEKINAGSRDQLNWFLLLHINFTTSYCHTEPPTIPPSNTFVLFQFHFIPLASEKGAHSTATHRATHHKFCSVAAGQVGKGKAF